MPSFSGDGGVKVADFGVSEFIAKTASGNDVDLSQRTAGTVPSPFVI